MITFDNSDWKVYSSAVAFPNKLGRRLNGNGGVDGAVVAMRKAGGRGRDFALSVTGLEHTLKREQERIIAEGYVVLGRLLAKGSKAEFVAEEKAQIVHERLRDIPPLDGDLGPYWWITEDFMPAISMGPDPDEAF
jgi:hypothetical protein